MYLRAILVGGCGLLAIGCGATVCHSGSEMGVTNLQPADDGRPPELVSEPRTTEAADALGAQDYAKVLALTETPSTARTGPWLDYDRGSALTGLGRTDQAAEAFKRAELRFGQVGDEAGRKAAIWGRAHAFDEAGRCGEARAVYQEFATFVRLSDPRAAEMAAAYSGSCRPVVVLH